MDSEAVRVRTVYDRRDVNRDRRLYSYFNAGNLFIIQERERRLLALLARNSLSNLGECKILEIGCGSGFWIREFIKWGARPENMAGVDLLSNRVSEARRLCSPDVWLECRNGAQLPFPDGSFDIVMQFTAFSSILDGDTRLLVAGEMMRVTKASGVILWYDFFVNNPANRDVRGVPKKEIKQLFAGCEISAERVTLAPPLARSLARLSWGLCHGLAAARVLNTHCLALIRPPTLSVRTTAHELGNSGRSGNSHPQARCSPDWQEKIEKRS